MASSKAAPAKAGPARAPHYQRVADELIQRIATGRYPVGAFLPTEMELCRQFSISRHTVRESLRRLRDAGLVSRRRRVGTEVVARTPPARYRQPTNSIADLLQYAEETRIAVLEARRVHCSVPLAELLECGVGDAWLRVKSVRASPGGDALPVCMTTAYVDARLPDIEPRVRRLTGPLSALLEREYGLRIARIEQSIQAVRLGKRQAALLRADEGSPALRAIRRYYDEGGALVELSNAVHPADRFTYVTSLIRG
ncbi:MAG: GntR family transcriptional regulator [Gemmatimonadaceae bacterium]